MAQPIKYNTGAKTANCCINRNNFDIGINTTYAYGPTSGTGFYAGYTVDTGGFVSYQNKSSQGPSIYNIPTIDDVQYFGTQLNIGTTLTTDIGVVIRTANAVNGLIMVNVDYPEIPQIENNIFTIDSGYAPSYGWGGAEWYDITDGTVTNATLTGLTTFVTGTSTYNYSDSYINMLADSQNSMALAPTFGSALQNFTINAWFKIFTSGGYNEHQNVVGQQYSTAPNYAAQTNCNFLIRGNNTNGYQGLIRLAGTDYTVDFGTVSASGNWVMLTLTYNGNEIKSFVNGVPKNSTAGPGVSLVSNGLQTIIGGTTNAFVNGGGPADYLDAGFGVVNIYDEAINETKITALYDLYRAQRNY
jgi:hypothetical protein